MIDGEFKTEEIFIKNNNNLGNIEYKFIKCNRDKNGVILKDIVWEDGANRKINL